MGWEGVAAITSVMVTLALGLLTYLRGSNADQALNIATNVQSTYNAQASLIDDLQAEVARTRAMFQECEGASREVHAKYAEARSLIEAQRREIETLKRVQGEHEVTIANHQRTIDQMSRRTDHPDHTSTDRTRQDDPT